jgi:hypothetical protein
VLHAEGEPLASTQQDPPGRRSSADLERHRGAQHEDVGAAAHLHPTRNRGDERLDQPVLRTRDELHLDLDGTARHLQRPHEQPRRRSAERVRVRGRAGRHRVDQHEGAGRGGEGGLQDERLVQVAPAYVGVRVGGTHGEVARCIVE